MLATKTAPTPESATTESATAKSATTEPAGVHASPAATALGPRRPAAGTAKSSGVPTHAAESARFPSATIVLRPRVRGRRAVRIKVLTILLVDVHSVSAHVLVEAVAGVLEVVVVVRGIR